MAKKYLITYFYYITGVTFGFDNLFYTEQPGDDVFKKESILKIQEKILEHRPQFNAAKIMNIIPLHDETPA